MASNSATEITTPRLKQPLRFCSVITAILTIPYTVFLLFAHVFQSNSNHQLFWFWVPRLIPPLINAHTGPYLVRHRHWTRMLLLLCVGLILVFTVNILGDPAINLLAILLLYTLSLFLYLAVFGSMYRNPYLTKLEFLFRANLLLTAAVLDSQEAIRKSLHIHLLVLLLLVLGTYSAITSCLY